MAIKEGDLVRMHYTGRLADGTVFDSSEGQAPLEFSAGSDELIPGVSQAVIGLEEGSTKRVEVSPEDGYGPRMDELERSIPRSNLPDDVSVGDQLVAAAGDQEVRVFVKAIAEDTAVVDANHPLAGQTLTFDITIEGFSEGDSSDAPPSKIILEP